jgi:hypothetical protein
MKLNSQTNIMLKGKIKKKNQQKKNQQKKKNLVFLSAPRA